MQRGLRRATDDKYHLDERDWLEQKWVSTARQYVFSQQIGRVGKHWQQIKHG